MPTTCTRCENTGFLNIHQIPEEDISDCNSPPEWVDAVLIWIASHSDHDVTVCDCCGDGDSWHDVPGEHYNYGDPPGHHGPYAYNGGLCECH